MYEHQTNEPGKFTHAVNGKTLSVNQILSYKSYFNDDFDEYDNRKGSKRGLAGSSQYHERKIMWQSHAREAKN